MNGGEVGAGVPSADETVSLQEAAELLGVHYMTAYRHVRLGLLPARKDGATWRLARADVEARRRGVAGRPGSPGRGGHRPAPWAERLANRLRAGDETGAWGVIEAALAAGGAPEDLYLDVVVPALEAIGAGWARGELDVGVEHRASAVATRLVGRLGPRFARRGRSRGAVVIGSTADELHALPTALLADLVRGRGFEAVDLGARLPPSSFAELVAGADRLVAVVVSVTNPGPPRAVAETVAAVRGAAGGVPVLVGGAGVTAEEVRRLDGDGSGRTGRDALELLEGLADGR